MGRKRKAGSLPSPLVPSFPTALRASSPSARSPRPAEKTHPRSNAELLKARPPGPVATSARQPPSERPTPTALTSLPPLPEVLPEYSSTPCPICSSSQGVPLPSNPAATTATAAPTPPVVCQHLPRTAPARAGAPAPQTPALTPVLSTRAAAAPAPGRGGEGGGGKKEEEGEEEESLAVATIFTTPPLPVIPQRSVGMTPSDVMRPFLHATGWRLGSCWGSGCDCSTFKPPPAVPSTAVKTSTTTAPAAAAATAKTGRSTATPLPVTYTATVCACGHGSCAHELVDVNDGAEGTDHMPPYRYYRRDDGAGASNATEMGVRLRQFFSAVRNARAVGDCGLFEDSEGVRGWGSGWFLSGLARGYIRQARQAMADLGGGLHDPPAVARCLAAAEALLSGDATGQWTMPGSLPSSSIYQALGVGIASELDLAYWHARYTAASRFDAGSVSADTASSSSTSHVVPPPEVYFVCLAFHVPSVAELRALVGLDTTRALRSVLDQVFDFPVGDAGVLGIQSTGLCADNNEDIRFPVLTNPLLAVAQSTWLETAVSAKSKSWVPHFPPRFGDNEGTMRGSDPGLPPPIRARCDATRDWSARLLAFAVPNRRAVDACRRALQACVATGTGGPGQGHQEAAAAAVGIVEVGAGLGYWKWVLEGGDDSGKAGPPLKFLAVDKDPSRLPRHGGSGDGDSATCAGRKRGGMRAGGSRHGGRGGGRKGGARGPRSGGQPEVPEGGPTHNEYHGGAPGWAAVEQSGPQRLRSLSAAAYPVLLLCYPPPSVGGSGISGGGRGGGVIGAAAPCMGADALASFSGKVLLYIGEVGGDTGSPRFEAALRAEWDLVEEVELPCFSCTANRLMVFTRKGVAGLHRVPLASVCRASAVSVARDEKKGEHIPSRASFDAAGSSLGGGGAGVWEPARAMYRCSGCGTAAAAAEGKGVRLHRCRLTRAVCYCSEKCLTQDSERWWANLEARHIHLAAGSAAKLAQQCGNYVRVFRDKKLFKRLALTVA